MPFLSLWEKSLDAIPEGRQLRQLYDTGKHSFGLPWWFPSILSGVCDGCSVIIDPYWEIRRGAGADVAFKDWPGLGMGQQLSLTALIDSQWLLGRNLKMS